MSEPLVVVTSDDSSPAVVIAPVTASPSVIVTGKQGPPGPPGRDGFTTAIDIISGGAPDTDYTDGYIISGGTP